MYEQHKHLGRKINLQKDFEIINEDEINYQGMFLTTTHPNNTVFLNDGSIVQIIKFCKNDNNVSMEVKKKLKRESIFNDRCNLYFKLCNSGTFLL